MGSPCLSPANICLCVRLCVCVSLTFASLHLSTSVHRTYTYLIFELPTYHLNLPTFDDLHGFPISLPSIYLSKVIVPQKLSKKHPIVCRAPLVPPSIVAREINHGGSAGSTFLPAEEGISGGNTATARVAYEDTTRPPSLSVYRANWARGSLLRGRIAAVHGFGEGRLYAPPFNSRA